MTETEQVKYPTLMNLPGPLMLAIMGVLWKTPRLNFMILTRRVCEAYKPVAVTTVSSTLTRMIVRGYVERVSSGMYRAAMSREQLIDMIASVIDEV